MEIKTLEWSSQTEHRATTRPMKKPLGRFSMEAAFTSQETDSDIFTRKNGIDNIGYYRPLVIVKKVGLHICTVWSRDMALSELISFSNSFAIASIRFLHLFNL